MMPAHIVRRGVRLVEAFNVRLPPTLVAEVGMAGKPYDEHDLLVILKMRGDGVPIPVIAASLGRTPAGIQGALKARGWVDPGRSQVVRCALKFTTEQRIAFRNFICSHTAGYTAADIRDKWNQEAALKGWPVVTSDRVFRCRRKSGLQPAKSECMQFESYRRKQSAAQKVRRAQERATRRQALRSRRAEIDASQMNLPRRKCQVCLEIWPLTEEFFRHAGCNGKYYLNTCRLCNHAISPGTAEERRAQRIAAYDRRVAVTQLSHARCERDAFLVAHRDFPTRRCSRCHENWELLPVRYPRYDGGDGKLYRKTCRFCLRAAERVKDRARKALNRVPATAGGRLNSVNRSRGVQASGTLPLQSR